MGTLWPEPSLNLQGWYHSISIPNCGRFSRAWRHSLAVQGNTQGPPSPLRKWLHLSNRAEFVSCHSKGFVFVRWVHNPARSNNNSNYVISLASLKQFGEIDGGQYLLPGGLSDNFVGFHPLDPLLKQARDGLEGMVMR
jgi:hypothetical protein